MPVWRSTDAKVDLEPNSGKQRRHISAHCPLYVVVPTAQRCKTDGVPNTKRVQELTVRCEHPDCWSKRLREDVNKPKRAKSGAGKVSASKASTTATTAVGGKAQSLADKAKAARQKPKAKAAA